MTSDGRNIITQLDDNTKVIFRMDVGEHAHSMDMYGYSNPVNHINIEIQVKASSGKYKPKWNFHMIWVRSAIALQRVYGQRSRRILYDSVKYKPFR